MKWGLWSTTANNNQSAVPDGWPEHQAPSTLNNCAREMMASVKTGITQAAQGFYDLGIVPTQTGATTFTVPNDQTAYLGYGRRVRLFDATTVNATVISSTATVNTSVTVRVDGGGATALTASLSSMAIAIVQQSNVLPETVVRRRTPLINGMFDIAQRTLPAVYSAGVATGYCFDHWNCVTPSTAGYAVTVSRLVNNFANSAVPTIAQAGVFLRQSLCISASGTVVNYPAVNEFTIRQPIEDIKWEYLDGKATTCVFWVNSTRTGIFCVTLRNSFGTCAMEYTINAASTWEKKVITFPKNPPALLSGMYLCFSLGGDTNRLVQQAGNWTATACFASINQTNFLSSAGGVFKLAFVDYKEGTCETPSYLPDSISDENDAERYFQLLDGGCVFPGGCFSSNIGGTLIPVPRKMRVSPTVLFPSDTYFLNDSGFSVSKSATIVLTNSNNTQVFLGLFAQNSPFNAGSTCFFSITTGGAVALSSELP